MNPTIYHLIEQLKYFGVFIGAFIEGPATALAAGLLIKSNFIQLVPAFLVHSLGDFLADMTYFMIGRFGSKKLIHWLEHLFHFSDAEVNNMKAKFNKHHLKIIFTGKLTHFLGLPAIIGIGLSEYSWRKFFIFNLIATVIKSALLVGLGYSFGAIWQQQSSLLSRLGLVIILTTVAIAIYYLMKRRKHGPQI
ncbi:hypothetical protein COV81_01870 [Candidatus Peregrinibacteria bacterium CG11_big_fil_rev_8_21_14_0_20_41_10]|nr:MAG: hypothetical protein COV81_01870 [Candidatus Peregrinibacteria bacterium CG11_big_fil_rev_8_21_14_0_20_41_10]PIZ77268.1 MAG: hypothetical protein COY06_00815 [Candidatus Peregrinibacteria bacterium CG_4_10_14_0_2_um_filter_41_8]PJC37736.1 MAG: hypothetical protein CO045_03960 [Candidatus Peregrinibacteria bacterium CG_4_9_14_0_2_um_filter_41_14]